MKAFITHPLLAAGILALASCGNDTDLPPPLVGTTSSSYAPAHSAYEKALAADQKGKTSKAIRLYRNMVDQYPTAKDSPLAKFRQAQLHEQKKDYIEAFDAYSDFLTRYQGSKLYTQALQRQGAIAEMAMTEKVKSGFLFSSKVDTSKLVEMLGKLRDAAPKAASASKAQFLIGEVYQQRGKANDAIEAYRKVVSDWQDSIEAPEAQYRVGLILIEQAERGNQDHGNLDRAREAFEDYLSIYPNGKRASAARDQVNRLAQQDLERSFDIADFYRRKGDLESARFYYREVLKQVKSGPLHDKAQAGLKALP
jgi:outer membrane protein assembly factor BamD